MQLGVNKLPFSPILGNSRDFQRVACCVKRKEITKHETRYGEFDWETLLPDIQNEYDILCVQLDELCDMGERISWEMIPRGIYF